MRCYVASKLGDEIEIPEELVVKESQIMNKKPTNETKEQWVILTFWPHEPTEVYGIFNSQKEALNYANRQGFHHTCAYDVHQILDIEDEE